MDFRLLNFPQGRSVTKMLRIMKLTAICIFLLSFHGIAKSVYSQNVSLDMKNTSLKKVFKEIKKQTGYYFLYSVEALSKEGKLDLTVKNAPLTEVLNKCLQNTPLTYSIVDKIIVIKKRPVLVSIMATTPEPPPTFVVSGKVTDEDGLPLPNVSVLIKGSNKGVYTDGSGIFSIQVTEGGGTLVFSYVGFESTESKVSKETALNISLKKKETKVEEVVIIGYGSVKKSDVTGSVSSIKSTDLKGIQIASVDQALQGRAAGVQVTNSDATPGTRPNIRIRGTNSLGTSSEPLFVIDGYPSNEDLSSINPNDIESIEILKDASATAIYGSRGANGVVLITTKRGRSGKLSIGLETYYGVASVSKTLDVMNAKEYADYRNEIVKNIGAPAAKPFASPAILDYLSTHTTDWQDAMFIKAPLSSLQLNMSGGDEKTKFLISGEYYKQEGIIRNTGFQRGNLRFNFDRQISKKVKFGLTAVLGKTLGNNTLVNTNGGTEGGVLLNLLRLNPAVPVYDSSRSGKYTYSNYFLKDANSDPGSELDQLGNPVAYSERVTNANYLNRGQISMFGEYEIINGLKLKLLLGVKYLNNWQNFYAPFDLFEQAQNVGTASRFNRVRINWLNENNLTYSKDFGSKFNITALAGVSFQKFKDESNTASATNFFTNAFTFNNIGAGAAASVSSSASQNQLHSYYSRINAKLWDNLLLTATVRADGSSKFGENYKYGYFPSGAVAYKLTDVKFIRKLQVISELKLRLGYGLTGNQEIEPYLSKFGYDLASAFSPGVAPGALVFGSTRQVAVSSSRPENPDLRWEQTSSTNAGIDFGIWSNKLNITIDWYKKTTKDLLWGVALPATTGFGSAFKNLGSIQNTGVEFGFSGTPIANKNFRWSSSLNFSINKNKILSLGDEPFRLYGANQFQALITRDNYIILQPGQEIGKFFLYDFQGIWQSQEEIDKSAFTAAYKNSIKPGFAKYKDISGDGNININDKQLVKGSAYPKVVFGFNNSLSYHGIELNVFVQGQQGNKIMNLNKYWMEYSVGSNKGKNMLGRWTGPGTSNVLPRAGYETSRLIAQDFLEDGSYLRLKSVSLSYQLTNTNKWLQAVNLNAVRLYVTGTNLLTITNYSGYDPEVNSYRNNLFMQGIDQGAYAVARSIIVGIKVGF
ncbi:MAG: TonB-dependent receptor [Ferruginibacter sp.]|nr:TonB-dependent receptor [Ferruginibacter sp.]